jgi:hypothetical protein
MKVENTICFDVNNPFLTLANFTAEITIYTQENGKTIYCASVSRADDYAGYPIDGDDFEDMQEAISWLQDVCEKFTRKELEERIKAGDWAKKRLADMNEFGMFN